MGLLDTFFPTSKDDLKKSAQELGDLYSEYTGVGPQNRANQAMSREQMRFQERMSNTAHQREVKDLRAAGLNPILSANAGASSPTGSTAEMQSADVMGGVTSAMDALRLRNEKQLAQSQLENDKAQRAALSAAAQKDSSSAKLQSINTKALEIQLEAIRKGAVRDEKQADWDLKAMDYDNYKKRMSDMLNDVNNTANTWMKRGIPINPEYRDNSSNNPNNWHRKK